MKSGRILLTDNIKKDLLKFIEKVTSDGTVYLFFYPDTSIANALIIYNDYSPKKHIGETVFT